MGDLTDTCLAVIFLLCKLWGFELGDKVHFGYCAHVLIYVAAVGLPICYVVIVGLASLAVGWYFYVLFHVVFVHL